VIVRIVWALFAAVGLAIFVTYWRLSPEELYNVSEEGLALAAGRLLVFLNYPTSIAAIPIAWLAAERIGTRRARWAAVVATILCAVTAWPDVVDQDDLDAKAINVVPAVGVAIAFALSVLAPWERLGRLPLDPARAVIGAVVWVAALVWIAAVLGFYFPGDVLLGEELRPGGEGQIYAAVHFGDHEGLDAALLVTAALLLSRLRPRPAVLYLLALTFVYGLAVEWRDFWFEQVVKRDWTSWTPPQVLTPSVSVEWGVLVLLALAVAVAVRRLEGPRRPGADPRRTSPSAPPDPPRGESTTGAPSP
jgi:hypothetical protein